MNNWLLLRGLGRDKRHWGSFPSKMIESSPDSEVLCLNLPGIDSDQKIPTNIPALTDQVRNELLSKRKSSENWNIMAISLGGMVAIDWCDRYPKDFNHLITINTSSHSTSPLLERLSPFALRTIARAALTNNKRIREKGAIALTSNETPLDSPLLDEWVEIAETGKLTRSNFTRQMLAAMKFNLPSALSVSYTVLASKGDRLCNYNSSVKIAKHFNADFHLHEKAGHDIPLDDPQWVLKILKDI